MTVVNYSFPMFGMRQQPTMAQGNPGPSVQPGFSAACGVTATDSVMFMGLPQGGFLKGKTAFVTGSSSGIGLAVAEQLASEGADIVLHGMEKLTDVPKGYNQSVQEKMDAMKAQYGVKVSYVQGGLGTEDEIKAVMAGVDAATGGDVASGKPGKVDILVNNAGYQVVKPFEEFPIATYLSMQNVMLTANLMLSQHYAPGMKQAGWGRIINVGSAHGLTASAGKVAYVTAKHGVAGMTKTMGIELANSGVTVNMIAPGYVSTPLAANQVTARVANGMTEAQAKANLMDKQARKEFATPEEIGQLALFLASDAAKSMVGQIISVDNGWTAGGH